MHDSQFTLFRFETQKVRKISGKFWTLIENKRIVTFQILCSSQLAKTTDPATGDSKCIIEIQASFYRVFCREDGIINMIKR